MIEKTMKITVTTEINSNIEKVWDAFTNPKHIVNWNFAQDDWYCPKSINDVRVGGKFSNTMSSKDGKYTFDFEGEYTKVEENKQLEFKIADGRTVEVKFETNGSNTSITETFEAENENSPELQKNGWQSILDNFKKYVESNK